MIITVFIGAGVRSGPPHSLMGTGRGRTGAYNLMKFKMLLLPSLRPRKMKQDAHWLFAVFSDSTGMRSFKKNLARS